jgi:hypothetical protein
MVLKSRFLYTIPMQILAKIEERSIFVIGYGVFPIENVKNGEIMLIF